MSWPVSWHSQSLIRFLYLAITWSNHDTSAYLNMHILHNSWFGTWRHCFQLATHFLLSYHLHLWWMIFRLSALRGRSRSYLRLGFTFRSLSYWPRVRLQRAILGASTRCTISHEASSSFPSTCAHTHTCVIPHIIHNHIMKYYGYSHTLSLLNTKTSLLSHL